MMNLSSCKTIARTALKYWTKKQVREFVSNCEDRSKNLLGEERAKKYCDCAVDVVAEKYRNYEDIKKTSLMDVLKIANDCK
jgi:hypothetical protein